MSNDLFSSYMVWFLVGLVFVLAELGAPGLILIFFGIGAWATAAVVFFWPLELAGQIGVFLLTSLLSLLILRRYAKKIFQGRTSQVANDDIEQSDLGKTAHTTKAITPTEAGEIKHRGTFWRAQAAQTIEVGQPVRITGRVEGDSQAFTVEPLPNQRN